MNNSVDHAEAQPMPALLDLSATTDALFQTWMTQALTALAILPEALTLGQTALVTLSLQEANDNTAPASAQTLTSRLSHFPSTTCTLSWQHHHWTICSLSNLTRIEESHPPSTEHAFWFDPQTVGYRMQWGAMCHEDTVAALQEWEQSLHSAHALYVLVTLEIDRQEYDVMIPVGSDPITPT